MSESAAAAIDSFAGLRSVQAYRTRAGARGKCHAVAVAFAMWLRAHGVENRIIRVLGPRPGLRRYLSEIELEVVEEIAQHAVYVEESLVVDFTWSMWEPEAPWPRVSTLEEYLLDFATMDDSICGVCGAYRLFNGETPPCKHLLPSQERGIVATLANEDG